MLDNNLILRFPGGSNKLRANHALGKSEKAWDTVYFVIGAEESAFQEWVNRFIDVLDYLIPIYWKADPSENPIKSQKNDNNMLHFVYAFSILSMAL